MADMSFALTDDQKALKTAVYDLCKQYSPAYWQELDAKREYPDALVNDLTKAGYLAVLIPQEYGGAGLGIMEGALILEEINRSGGNAGACHAQMYIMGTVLRHGSEQQKNTYLPKIATGELRLQAFGVTEPNAGSDTTKLQTTALRKGDTYVVNGQKMFISRVLQSDLMLLLARTTPVDQVKKKTDGLSVFLIDIRHLKGKGLEVRPLKMMMNHSTNALFFDNMEIPADSLIGEEGRGFSYILDGMNAERILVASDSLGDARWFIEKAVAYSSQRVIFGKPIGANQGVQFPIAKAHMAIEAADLMRTKAAKMFDAGIPCGPEANMAKYLASEAAIEAGNACLDCHGGYGFAEEYDIERKFRESRLYRAAPINNNLVMAYVGEHVLGMPRSY
ncbi:MAG TPA: acyl-CoA dehydrogenase family protein [Candidatus Acidoferrales bacterium]|nr:acyl-CoA dehydrogenase family protein [Candidatus Acidoferrales bacterium]